MLVGPAGLGKEPLGVRMGGWELESKESLNIDAEVSEQVFMYESLDGTCPNSACHKRSRPCLGDVRAKS